MSSRPRFLLVSPELPWPPDQGSRQLQLDVAEGLSRLGDLTWVSRDTGGGAARELAQRGFQLELDRSFRSRHPLRRAWRRARIDLAAARARRPRELAFVSSPGVRRIASRVARNEPRAVAVGVYWSTWPSLLCVPRERRVLVVADVEYAAQGKGAALGRVPAAHVEQLRQAEVEAFRSAGLVLCLTPEDERSVRIALEQDPGGGAIPAIGRWPVRLEVPAEPAPPRPQEGGGLRLLCYGHWEAGFNRDGLEHFLGEIWPAMRQHPLAPRLQVAGRGLGGIVAPDGAELLGWVEDLPAKLAASDAVVIPLRFGGGLRYRLLEAMAFGRPVLCSAQASRGSGAKAGEHFLLAGTPEEWHDQLAGLAGEAGMRLARRAHGFVRDHFGPRGRHESLKAELSRLPALADSPLEEP